MHVYCFILRQANGTHQGYKPHDYDWREMVSHVPFLDLNTVKKDKRITISQFILCVLLFFMRFRLPVQNAFKDSCQHSTTEPGQKQRLPFYDISLVVQKKKMFFFGYYRTSWYTSQTRSTNTIISCWSCVRLIITVEIHMLVCVYIANRIPPSSSSLWVCYINFITLAVEILLY